MKKTVLFFLLLGWVGGYCQDEPWQEPGCLRRVAIHLPEVDQSRPVSLIITGYDFWRWTGFPRPRINSFRLFQGDTPLAYQGEERQPDGLPASPDGFLDDTDLLVFVATLSRKPVPIYLYYDGLPTQPVPPGCQPEIIEKKGDIIPLFISAGGVKVGIRGGGTVPGTQDIRNFGRGSFVFLSWKGQTLLDFRSSWGNYLPRGLASGKDGPVWSEPEIVFSGPVRTVVAVRCHRYSVSKDNQPIFTGEIVRLLSVWHNCPTLELEEYVSYQSTEFDWSWPYSFSLPVGKSLDENDRLIVPLAGQPYVRPVTKTRQEIQANPWERLYSTENPEEGWFAWQDTQEKTGLAFFYEKLEPIRQRHVWVTYRPALHPQILVRTTPYPTGENNLSILDRALACRSHYRRQLQYVLLTDESPETIRAIYHLWARIPGTGLSVSLAEKQRQIGEKK
ncbi:MAG: hypothetical protein NC911_10930 [Candidatus Omnitrophica bacterium]|nr:hypothetical protein [Candidatus Omnitrophota bacterium]